MRPWAVASFRAALRKGITSSRLLAFRPTSNNNTSVSAYASTIAEPRSEHGFEVVPYTLVGLATCLEWHARSRVTDLYTYKPESIEPDILTKKVPSRVLAQMIKANVSIPQFLGANFTVGSTQDYLSVFSDVFRVLGIGQKPDQAIQPPIVEQVGLFGDPIHQPRVRERLDELFATRHALVHEIGQNATATRSHCEIWKPQNIIGMCHTVLSTINALERVLTAHAPPAFPNLLTVHGFPVDERDRLAASIKEVETSIGAEIALRHPDTQALWQAALREAHSSVATHETLFEERRLFQKRHVGRANALSRSALQHRLTLLKEIAAELAKTSTVASG